MGASPLPKPFIPAVNLCRDCEYFQLKWKSVYSEWSYCDYWHKEVRSVSVCCDKFEENHSNVEQNGKDWKE